MARSSVHVTIPSTDGELVVPLRDPAIAAVLAWLCPGAGHLYQGRTGKGLLFMVCILSTFFFGLTLGGGRCVYASQRDMASRVMYAFQLGTGLPALPAVVQALRVQRQQPPLWKGWMAPPSSESELSDWNYEYGAAYDLGILYTMIAGLLNVLVIFDAYAGPHLPPEPEPRQHLPSESTSTPGDATSASPESSQAASSSPASTSSAAAVKNRSS